MQKGRRGGGVGSETWVVWAAEGNAFVGSRAPVVHRHWVMMAAFFFMVCSHFHGFVISISYKSRTFAVDH